jgi:DNA gyrase/topoisomerase IV subunit A
MGCKLSRSITSDVSKSNSRRVCRGPGALDTSWVWACELASEYEASMMPFDVEIIKKERDVLKAQVKNLSEDLDDFKRELTDRSNALEATKQDWHEARKTITKLEADKALAIKFIKTISKTKEGIRYWCDNSAHTQYSSMHSDAHTTCKECGASEDGPGEQIYSSVLTRDAELAVEALKKLEAAE